MRPDARAVAALALAEVAMHGASLREVLARHAGKLTDARDRALLTALAHHGSRWWLRYDAAIDGLLAQPLRHKEPAIHALLVLGLVQLEVMDLSAYAAVAASVEAARALGCPRFAGLVNAVLRRWQRERVSRNAALDAQPRTRHAHPAWLAAALEHDWPGQAEAIMAANNREPPLTLRANRRHAPREELRAGLAAAGVAATAHPWLADALVLPHSVDVSRLPGFAEGAFAVQDGAAQVAADLLAATDGMRVLDACAAPGGKACHVLERARVELTALEWGGRPCERVLVEAACLASGGLRRRPDVRLHRRASGLAALGAQQRRIITALWPLLAPGGVLVYATCSVLRGENEAIVETVLHGQPDARARNFALPAGQRSGPGWQILPGDDGLDGMYYAVLEKLPAAVGQPTG